MSIRKKLKKMVIDNVIALVISFVIMMGGALLLSEHIAETFRVVWFICFFAGFGVFMYNLCVIFHMGDFTKHLKDDINDLKGKDK